LAINEGVESGQMPEMFKGALTTEMVKEAMEQWTNVMSFAFTEFEEDVQRILLKLRATFKRDYKPDPDLPYSPQITLMDWHTRNKVIELIPN